MIACSEVEYMPYTSVSKSDKNRFGLRSHAVPMIIAFAYLVDSIEAEMTLLRGVTLILAVCYIITMAVAIIRRRKEISVARRRSG